jgi:hypothetical protein
LFTVVHAFCSCSFSLVSILALLSFRGLVSHFVSGIQTLNHESIDAVLASLLGCDWHLLTACCCIYRHRCCQRAGCSLPLPLLLLPGHREIAFSIYPASMCHQSAACRPSLASSKSIPSCQSKGCSMARRHSGFLHTHDATTFVSRARRQLKMVAFKQRGAPSPTCAVMTAVHKASDMPVAASAVAYSAANGPLVT